MFDGNAGHSYMIGMSTLQERSAGFYRVWNQGHHQISNLISE